MSHKKYEINELEVWDGAMAVAHALRQSNVDVMAAYPITPSTPIIQNYGNFSANGYIDGVFTMVESEHGAMSACVGAAAAGGRVATATASQGFALMIEVLYQASGMRIPLVLAVANRALAAPLNVNGDHSDMYLGRDSGWVQLCAYSAQEAYDLTLMSFKIGEHKDVRLPVMVHQDGFITSHTATNVHPLQDDVAGKFVGKYLEIDSLLDFSKPVTHGAQTEEGWHFEHKAKQHYDLMTYAPKVINDTFDEFYKLTGRKYSMLEEYCMEDAEIAIVCTGSSVLATQIVVDELRKSGVKAGSIGIRVLRPFPVLELKKALANVKAVASLDRSSPNGALGALYNEVAGAVINSKNRPVLNNYIYGLGGRDLLMTDIKKVYDDLSKNAKSGTQNYPLQQFLNLKGDEMSFFKEGK